jgi:hypothetical protein
MPRRPHNKAGEVEPRHKAGDEEPGRKIRPHHFRGSPIDDVRYEGASKTRNRERYEHRMDGVFSDSSRRAWIGRSAARGGGVSKQSDNFPSAGGVPRLP